MKSTKPFKISKFVVEQAWELVKANKGAGGVDGETIEQFESNLKDNLYKLWNRMSSGTYFPQAVRTVGIPKKDGGERKLGIPSITDRIAQMVAKLYVEPLVEPHFHKDSYGYRSERSAHQALEITRKRCWKYDWVLEFDIKGLFDNISHELLMKAVRKHTDNRWLILYIERWIKAPVQMKDGTIENREEGVPQGGVISPVLSNLFMHYAFDKWMERTFPNIPWCRYADDGLVHCKSKAQAKMVRASLEKRFEECGLEMHPTKTRIVYCKDDNRREEQPVTSFDFLGYTFRPRRSKNRAGKFFISFTPAMSRRASKAIKQEVRSWRLNLRTDKELEDLAKMFGVRIQGWINYYSRFYKSEMYPALRQINRKLSLWAMRKYKKLKRHRRRAEHRLGRIAKQQPDLFPHWRLGVKPSVG